ncbi:MAG: hypothetical protein O8C66_02015 [Candidatus Methanoperedens sp.]|nr:hypothetical protein [Candidatus Methanoperedens sp.]MCZ7369261.1 hypothetical protein [Candidatus Methanoperedens sp.]
MKYKRIIIILSVLVLLGLTLFFSFQPTMDKTRPEKENGSSNISMANNNQNTTSAAKNTISIPLEKPPFIKD